MIRLLIVFGCFVFIACSTSKNEPPARAAYRLNVKYENVKLATPREWLGGTVENPRYFTSKGQEIITPVFGVDVVPVTKRSIDNNGRVLYPHAGYQVVGDLRLAHFLRLMKKVERLDLPRKSYKAPLIIADSNLLERGAIIKGSEREFIVEYEFKALGWYLKR